jgi:hypothetical protein
MMLEQPVDRERELVTLNIDVATWEQTRDAASIARLDDCLSRDLVFRRADRRVVDKEAFMKGLRDESPFVNRESHDVSVSLVRDRAMVTVIVSAARKDGTVGWYRNVRLFFRRGDRWQMEVWFNDDVTSLMGDRRRECIEA